jgi:hypothetical protein
MIPKPASHTSKLFSYKFLIRLRHILIEGSMEALLQAKAAAGKTKNRWRCNPMRESEAFAFSYPMVMGWSVSAITFLHKYLWDPMEILLPTKAATEQN